MFDSFDPRWSDARDRHADRELDREIYRDSRERSDDPRDALLNDLDLPRGRDRELVLDRDRVYELNGEDGRTLAAVGAFRVIPERDLDTRDEGLDGRNDSLEHLIDEGLVRTVSLDGHDRGVVLTDRGHDLLEANRRDRDDDRQQEFYAGVNRPRELSHDAQLYRVYERAEKQLRDEGADIRRVVLEQELKREYQSFLQDHNRDRPDSDGRPDRDAREIAQWALDHELPYFDDRVHLPDFRIEYDFDGREGHRDVEVLTPHYRGAHAASRGRTGFTCFRVRQRQVVRSGAGGGSAVSVLTMPAEYFDSVRPARVAAVAGFGFTERQARFLVTVMVHSGVFLERQYCTFAGISHGQKSHDFVAKLTNRRFATAITPGRLHQGRLFHVHYKPLYEAVGEPDNRHRKTVSLGRMIERLMILDGVLADRNYTWLGTERDKRDYFDRALDAQYFRPADYPHVTYRAGAEETTRFFPDKLPIGIEKHGFQRHVFLYLMTRDVPVDFRLFLLRHAELLRTVPQFTIRLLIPRRFRKSTSLYRFAFRDELAMPVDPTTAEQLQAFFRHRQEARGHFTEPANEDLEKAFRKFGAARFKALYRWWLRKDDPAIWAAQSPVLRDAIAHGNGRLECVELSHQYLQLTSLVGVA